MKISFVITNIPASLATGDKSAYEGFKEVFLKYFDSFDIQPRSAQNIYEITVYKSSPEVLAGFVKEGTEKGITFQD